MLRRSLMAVLVVVALAGMAQQSKAACRGHRGGVVNCLFGGYGRGPFGNGYCAYAGYYPPAEYTCCGCRIR
jgi:hypothetical protein